MANILRYLGLCEESEFAENPAPDAVMHVDITEGALDVPADSQMIYGGGISRGPNVHRPAFYAPAGSVAYAFDIRTIGFLLKWALGGYSFSAGTPNEHTIYGANTNILDSFCARLGKDVFEHVFSGCVINTLSINIDGEYCMATADIRAAKDAKADLKELSELLLPDEYPLAWYEVRKKIADSEVSSKVKNLNLEINNNVGDDSGRVLGSRYPKLFRCGERTVTLSSNLVFDDTSELERFWGGEGGPSGTGTSEFGLELDFDAGAGGEMKIELPRFIYTSVGQQPSGRDELVQTANGRAFLPEELTSETDTDITVTLKNDQDDMALAS